VWNANGVLVQGLHEKTSFIKNFAYGGIHAYFSFPLIGKLDKECRKLTSEQMWKQVSENEMLYLYRELISDGALLERYLKKCGEMGIDVRALFVESGYPNEIWQEEKPPMRFLGYEYCPFPIDEQIITNLDWYEPFAKFREMLNEYGLFNSYGDALAFVEAYRKAESDGEIGDGEIEAHICKVSELIL